MAEHSRPFRDPDEIIREVWGKDDIQTKTDLNFVQVEAVNKLGLLSTIFGSGLVEEHILTFMQLQKSLDRKSMNEFVTALRNKREDYIDKKGGNFALFG